MDSKVVAIRSLSSGVPPRVRELPLLGSAIGMARDPLGFLERAVQEHGDTVLLHLPGQTVYLFNHPDAIEQMLVSEREHLIKDRITRGIAPVVGNGLLVSEGAFWRNQRRLTQPAFHRERITGYAEVAVRHTERALSTWRDGEVRDVHADLMRLTLDIVAEALFDLELGERARVIHRTLETVMARYSGASALIPLSVPTPVNLRAKRAIRELDEVVYAIIAERRQSGARGDLVSMLMAASAEDGEMTDQQVRDESVTLLLAGHETTAATLGFALDLLARHPVTQARLASELNHVLGARAASYADVPELSYTEAVVREAMRLYPPAWAIGREAIAECSIGGYRVAPGTELWACQWLVHRDARWFPDPTAFRPERWLNDAAKSLPRFAYFPFGGGARVCIGNAFAMMESVLVLATLSRRFHFATQSNRPLALNPSFTLRPKAGIHLKLTSRSTHQRSSAPALAL